MVIIARVENIFTAVVPLTAVVNLIGDAFFTLLIHALKTMVKALYKRTTKTQTRLTPTGLNAGIMYPAAKNNALKNATFRINFCITVI